ncbi:MAG: helix-turn-helix domain-containing protein [Candidatus Pacearchaeota archaeon]
MEYLDLRASAKGFVEAIRDGEIVRIPHSVAIEEDLFILRTLGAEPQQIQSQPSPIQNRQAQESKQGSVFSDWKVGKFGGKKNNVIQDLVPNFHWEIAKQRKARNLTRNKLGEIIRSSEHEVKMLELGELPADDFVLISRIEQFFGINLRKFGNVNLAVNLADLQKRKELHEKEARSRVSNPSTSAKVQNSDFAGNDIELVED